MLCAPKSFDLKLGELEMCVAVDVAVMLMLPPPPPLLMSPVFVCLSKCYDTTNKLPSVKTAKIAGNGIRSKIQKKSQTQQNNN